MKILRDGEDGLSRLAHNQKIGGSNPSPATKRRTDSFYSKFDGKSDHYKNKTNKILLKFFKIWGDSKQTQTILSHYSHIERTRGIYSNGKAI